MRRILLAILSIILPAGFLLSQQSGQAGGSRNEAQPKQQYYTYADITKPIQVGDSTYIYQKGRVVVYHNGAVITCDSAVRYSDSRVEFFHNVVINQNTTYVYGNRVEYDNDKNMARVYAPIVKVVDGDATLYTRNFTFNLVTNVGRYFGGGTMRQASNYMESNEGYYYADSSIMVGVGAVELRNPDYQLRSDSVSYNMNTEVASFWTKTYIWNSKGEILSAQKGAYHNLTRDYEFRSHAYILTEDQEIWADSMDYNPTSENAKMYGNIQMRADKNGIMAFGDYGEYWGAPQNGLLTRNPSVVSYGKEKGDTVYMRSDSMFLMSYDRNLILHKPRVKESDILRDGEERIRPGSDPRRASDADAVDTLSLDMVPDSLAIAPADSTLTPKDLKRLAKEAEFKAKQEERSKQIRARLVARAKKAEARQQEQAERDSLRIVRRNAKKGVVPIDSTLTKVDSLPPVLAPDSLAIATDSLPPSAKDSLQRVIYAYNNVRIYARDYQAVCDSLVGFSIDSTMHLYIEPILWNGNNQLTAASIDLSTKDKQLDNAYFDGDPMMISEVEIDDKYNQVKGRTMESFFRDNSIYQHNVDGNAKTLYFGQDDKTGEYIGFWDIESANASFLIDSMQLYRIVYRLQPAYTMYPMDKIPTTQSQRLAGFTWQIERRPELETVFNRSIRESERSEYEGLSQPQFPITENLLKQRDSFIRQGTMVERNDRLTPFTITKIRTSFDPNYGKNPDDEVSRGGTNVITSPEPWGGTDSLSTTSVIAPDSIKVAPAPVAKPDSIAMPKETPILKDSVIDQIAPVAFPDVIDIVKPVIDRPNTDSVILE